MCARLFSIYCNRVFLSRSYRLIVAQRKFDVLKTNMLVLRTFNFQGATITPIVPRMKHSIVFIIPALSFLPRALIQKRGSSITFLTFRMKDLKSEINQMKQNQTRNSLNITSETNQARNRLK